MLAALTAGTSLNSKGSGRKRPHNPDEGSVKKKGKGKAAKSSQSLHLSQPPDVNESRVELKNPKKQPPRDSSFKLFAADESAAIEHPQANASVKHDAEKATHETREYDAFRQKLGIRVGGGAAVPPVETFQKLVFPASKLGSRRKEALLAAVETSLWKEPTAVQMQSIPLLGTGRDVAVSSATGSGKTGAFVIAAIMRLSASLPQGQPVVGPRVLILAPTRELAVQIHREATFLATGSTISVQLLECGEKKATTGDILLVSTPMHVAASLRSGKVCLSGVELLVLDEADRLFELGHGHEAPLPKELALMGGGGQMLGLVDEVLAKCDHPKVQRALFSATMGDRVAELVASVLRDPVSVAVGLANAGASTIEQRLMFVGREQGKLVAIRQLVQEGLRPPVLVFMQSKERAKDLYHELMFDGINVDYITTDMSVEKRDATIRKFRLGKVWVLLCTDLLARGVDFKGVNMVINYDFPSSSVTYIHRIGRTGRAGRQGLAVTLFTESDMPALRSIANVIRLSGGTVPDWMLSLKKERRDVQKRRERGAPPKRHSLK